MRLEDSWTFPGGLEELRPAFSLENPLDTKTRVGGVGEGGIHGNTHTPTNAGSNDAGVFTLFRWNDLFIIMIA